MAKKKIFFPLIKVSKMACLVLAAGEGTRFGYKKQLVNIDGQPMVNKVLMELKPIFFDDLFVVVGAFKQEVIPVIRNIANPIVNDCWSEGMGSSIKAGVKKICSYSKYDSLLIALADQIGIKQNDYELLISNFNGDRVVATTYENGFGVPAVFPFSYFLKLLVMDVSRGAKSILNDTNNDILGVHLPGGLMDIDTHEDLNNYLKSISN